MNIDTNVFEQGHRKPNIVNGFLPRGAVCVRECVCESKKAGNGWPAYRNHHKKSYQRCKYVPRWELKG